MDVRELPSLKRDLDRRIAKEFIAFEERTGMFIKGFKIKRVDSAALCPVIDYVMVKVEVPEMD